MPFQLTIEEARELHILALELENEGELHKQFTAGLGEESDGRHAVAVFSRSARITRTVVNGKTFGEMRVSKHLFMRELLRVHLNRNWGTSQAPPNRALSVAKDAQTIAFPEVDADSPDAENYFVKVKGKAQTLSEARADIHDNLAKATALLDKVEKDFTLSRIETMTKNAEIITITTKTLVNDVDVATLGDSQVYDLIAAQEAKIAELEAIQTKPKKLVAEIEKRRAGIAALVAHLDSKE